MFRDVEWTGGNMMQLSHPRLTLQANRLLSGVAAVPIAERVFAGLLRRVRGIGNDATNDDDDSDDDDDDESENATTTAMTTTLNLSITPTNVDLQKHSPRPLCYGKLLHSDQYKS